MTIPALPSYPMPRTSVRNRVDWRPDARRAALLIHDMQDYFLGKYAVTQAPIPDLITAIVHLRNRCRALGIPVYYTAQPPVQPEADRALLNDFWGPGLTAPEHQDGARIVAALRPRPEDTVLTKWRYSAFQRSDLRDRLRTQGRDQLIISGVYAHIGCLATALEAFMQDIQPFLVIDACADFSLEDHLMAVTHIARRCGVSLTLNELFEALAQDTAPADPAAQRIAAS
ncbi:MAG: isochorismatase family protein [Castellaniella sp.]|uniref:isochorismatase family protein n=1 Tax=Castellaniella sp. TaxID=1955812 RepID=UPI002A365D7A|nr:isochorismatase family protein [Castellaniella sp.]MDY0310020.1 isochorismatase family protein [Castellaniella sp.]